MKKFEYDVSEIVFHGEVDFQNELNFKGKAGWELVSTKWCHYDEGQPQIICVFKKEIE